MWKKNFLFRATESTPLSQSENELFHDTEPALDSAGLVFEKFLSVWVQGEGTDENRPPLRICMSGPRCWMSTNM